MAIYLSNSFSLGMLPKNKTVLIKTVPVSPYKTLYGGDVSNVVGHPTTDIILRGMLAAQGIDVPVGERQSISLEMGDRLVVAQYDGPRLPEGATVLPEEAKFDFVLVTLESVTCSCDPRPCGHGAWDCSSCEVHGGHAYRCPRATI